MFNEAMPILESIKHGFIIQNEAVLTEAETKFIRVLTSNLPFAEKLVKKIPKDDIEKKFLRLLPHLQLIAMVARNLINTKKKKIASDVLFSDKALHEIIDIYTLMQAQWVDTRDFILTKNPDLKVDIKTAMEKIYKMADECVLEHEYRLITGLCMPKASYLYLIIVDSIKRISGELTSLSEKL
jgi:Na+/phosphate symporter